MSKQKIEVKGIVIHIEEINQEDYISLTDIAKKKEARLPSYVIQNWMKNRNTIEFLGVWEKLHNPEFKHVHLDVFLLEHLKNDKIITPKRWIEKMSAKGIISKQGRGGGTYAHQDIALNFLYWISPVFQLYFIKEFRRLKEDESKIKSLKWFLNKITDNIDDVRNLLDSTPFNEDRKRIK